MTAMVLLSQWMESQVEFWMPTEYEGYDVSNFGQVRSYWGTRRGIGCRGGFTSARFETPRLMNASRTGNRSTWYKMVTVRKGNAEEKTLTVHRLVAKAFVANPDPDNFSEVNHKNLIKSDARAGNLEWTDHNGNHAHMDANGMRPKGESQWKAVITDDIARAIHQGLRDGVKGVVLARRFGVNKYVISNIKCGRTWKHVE